jgi:hypothetical protein
MPLEVFLYETRTQVDIQLYKRRIANDLEAVNLACFDDKNITRASFECGTVDRPDPSTFSDELNLVIRMTMGTWSGTRVALKKEHRNASVTLFGSNKLMRTADKRQIFVPHVMHLYSPLGFCELAYVEHASATVHQQG